ncbi:carboxymuconolactone decarboxylase family protein [Sphingobacterium sp. N143]|uniref:carboxymuconolactone decarboxylase family protein n=1 Tax=Sphingobacterium sp. N143 TaxID=2746727 RepID=UPI00257605A3|nr:carboxymuconolactone decarboxylase family protein [Sphingobacterium sp. N143]MDM1293994.1 carboxymuconolactone decarboxylase family protein [Sphingobacterium sp. N143]
MLKLRMDIGKAEPKLYKAMGTVDRYLSTLELEPKLQELIRTRVSQLNGCGYCINAHTQAALELGETAQRLFALAAWWETPFFTEMEQAVLKLAEEVAQIDQGGVSDATYEHALSLLGEQKLAQVILVTVTIGSWNRIAVAMHMVAGQ